MSAHAQTGQFPRGPLLGAAALVCLTLLSVAVVRLAAPPAEFRPPAVAASGSRDLRFMDRSDGAVVALEGPSDQVVAVIEPGTNGFLRGVLRGLARERKSMGIGDRIAFRIGRPDGGRLMIEDLATGRRVDLDAFGPTNSQAFARLLRHETPATPPRTPEGVSLQARATTR